MPATMAGGRAPARPRRSHPVRTYRVPAIFVRLYFAANPARQPVPIGERTSRDMGTYHAYGCRCVGCVGRPPVRDGRLSWGQSRWATTDDDAMAVERRARALADGPIANHAPVTEGDWRPVGTGLDGACEQAVLDRQRAIARRHRRAMAARQH